MINATTMTTPQRGFSLISAIFLLVVVAGLGTAMLTFSTNQQQSSALDVLGSRAYQAARSGMEWSAFQIARSDVSTVYATACQGATTTTTLPALAGTLAGFTVTVQCSATTHDDGSAATPVWVYRIVSTARTGTAGTATFVERQIEASLQ